MAAEAARAGDQVDLDRFAGRSRRSVFFAIRGYSEPNNGGPSRIAAVTKSGRLAASMAPDELPVTYTGRRIQVAEAG